MAEGRSNEAISEQLHLSPKTVEAYVRGVFTKLGLYQAVDDNRRVLRRSGLPPWLSLRFTGRPSGGWAVSVGPVWRHARPRRACRVERALRGDCSMG